MNRSIALTKSIRPVLFGLFTLCKVKKSFKSILKLLHGSGATLPVWIISSFYNFNSNCMEAGAINIYYTCYNKNPTESDEFNFISLNSCISTNGRNKKCSLRLGVFFYKLCLKNQIQTIFIFYRANITAIKNFYSTLGVKKLFCTLLLAS